MCAWAREVCVRAAREDEDAGASVADEEGVDDADAPKSNRVPGVAVEDVRVAEAEAGRVIVRFAAPTRTSSRSRVALEGRRAALALPAEPYTSLRDAEVDDIGRREDPLFRACS